MRPSQARQFQLGKRFRAVQVNGSFRPIADIRQTCILRLEMPNVPVPPFYAPPRWEGALIAVIGIAGYVLLAQLFGEGRGTVAGGFVVSFGVAVRIGWPLRKKVWFWATMLVLAALHVLLVVRFKWSAAADWKGPTFMPFMAADIALILAVVYLIYRWRYGVPTELVGEPVPRYADESDYPID